MLGTLLTSDTGGVDLNLHANGGGADISPALVQQSVQALRSVLAPETNRLARQEAQNFLLAQRDQPYYSALMCHLLTHRKTCFATVTGSVNMSALSRSQQEAIAAEEESMSILLLTMLHDWLKSHWDQVSFVEQTQIRNFISTLLTSLGDGEELLQISTTFSSKLAALISDIAQRQFPQNWPSFTTEMIQLWLSGPLIKQEVILKTLQYLYTDCIDTDFTNDLSSTRRQEILQGLQCQQKELLSLTYQFFMLHLGHITASASSTGAEMEVQVRISRRVLLTVIHLVVAMAKTSTVDDLFSTEQNFAIPLSHCLSIPGLQLEAVHALEKLFNPTGGASTPGHPSGSSEGLDKAKLAQILEIFFSRVDSIVFPTDPQDSFHFVQVFADALMTLLFTHFRIILEVLETHQQYIVALLTKLMECLHHPSRRTCGVLLGSWGKLFKHEGIRRFPYAEDLARSVLQETFMKVQRPMFVDYPDVYDEETWYELEFDDIDEWKQYHGFLVSHFRSLITDIAAIFPQMVAGFLVSNLRSLVVEQSEKVTGNEISTVMFCKGVSFLTSIMDQAMLFLRKQADLKEDVEEPGAARNKKPLSTTELQQRSAPFKESLQFLDNVLTLMFQWQPTGHRLLRVKLECFSHSHVLLNASRTRLFEVFTFLFQQIRSLSTTTPGTPEFTLSEYAAQTLATILYKCTSEVAQPEVLNPLLNEVGTILTSAIQTDTTTFSASVSLALREALVVLSTSVKETATVDQIYALAVEPMLVEFEQLIANNFSSTNQLLQNFSNELYAYSTTGTAPPIPSQTAGVAPTPGTVNGNGTLYRLIATAFSGVQAISNIFTKFHSALDLNHPIWKTYASAASAANPANPANSQNHPTIVSFQRELLKHFRPTMYYLRYLRACLQLSICLQAIWEPSFVPILRSTAFVLPTGSGATVPISMAQLLYGVSKSEVTRHLSSGEVEMLRSPASISSMTPGAVSASGTTTLVSAHVLCLQNLIENLFVSTYKSLGYGCHLKLFYTLFVLFPETQSWYEMWIGQQKFLEHAHYAAFLKGFAEPFTINVPPQVNSLLVQTLSNVFDCGSRRLEYGWKVEYRSDIRTVLSGSDYDELQHIVGLYSMCNTDCNSLLFANASSNELLITYRTNAIRATSITISQFLHVVFGLRGPLSVKAGTDLESRQKNERFEKRKQAILRIFFSTTSVSSPFSASTPGGFFSSTNTPLLQSCGKLIMNLFIITDATLLMSVLTVLTHLLTLIPNTPSLIPLVGQDSFDWTIRILISAQSWASGCEWQLIDYFVDVFRCICVPDPNASGGGAKVKGGDPMKNMLSPIPMQVLANYTNQETAMRYLKAVQVNKVRRKLREVTKDLFAPMIQATSVPSNTESGAVVMNELLSSGPRVRDISQKFERPKQKPTYAPEYDTDVADLFPDL